MFGAFLVETRAHGVRSSHSLTCAAARDGVVFLEQQNICRKRTLVAIGTHDLSTIQAPFHYKALPPSEISFQPLMEDRVFTADALMHYYEHEKANCKLKPYVKIISSSPVYPVIYDSRGVCLLDRLFFSRRRHFQSLRVSGKSDIAVP